MQLTLSVPRPPIIQIALDYATIEEALAMARIGIEAPASLTIAFSGLGEGACESMSATNRSVSRLPVPLHCLDPVLQAHAAVKPNIRFVFGKRIARCSYAGRPLRSAIAGSRLYLGEFHPRGDGNGSFA